MGDMMPASDDSKRYPDWWFDCEVGDKFMYEGRKYRIVNEPWPRGWHGSERVYVDSTTDRPVERFTPDQLIGVKLWEGVEE